jgi:hypothetical protein
MSFPSLSLFISISFFLSLPERRTRLYYSSVYIPDKIKGYGRTSPEPVLKNLFFVPECDFSLSSVGDVDANPLVSSRVVIRDVDAWVMGLKNRVRSDMVRYGIG